MKVRLWSLGVLALSATFATGAPAGASPAEPVAPADDMSDEFVLTSKDSFVAAEAWEARNDFVAGQPADDGLFQPFTDGGFTTFGERSYGDYTIRLVTSAEGDAAAIEEYRDDAQQLASEINAALGPGLSIQVASGTVAGPAEPLNLGAVTPTGEIWVMISSTSPCGPMNTTTGVAGCGGPTGGAVIDGVFRWTEGAAYIRPNLGVGAFDPDTLRQIVTSHEIGHALGLDHFNDLFEGNFQVMKSSAQGNGVLKSGDLNGVNWLSGPVPSNDSPSGAAAVCPGDSSVSASTWFARADVGEAAHAGVGPRRSLWYKYQPRAEQNGLMATIRTTNDGIDDFDTVLAVYSGATPIVPVISDNNSGGGTQSQVSFLINSSLTYWIAVDGVGGIGSGRGETDLVFDLPDLTTSLVPLCAPARLLDTRPSGQTIDGQHQGVGQIAANTFYTLQIAGRAGVPANAASVVLNVTAVVPAGGGFVTVFPCGALPNASNLNFAAGDVIPNSVLARLDGAGRACFFSSVNTHLLVDISGFFLSTIAFTPLDAPGRLLDTRVGGQTIDGAHAAVGPLVANVAYELPVTDRAGVPLGSSTVVLNVTAVQPSAGGFLTVYPCGETPPNASNLNFVTGDIIPNLVLARVGAGGRVCFVSSIATNLLVDVSGYFANSTFLVPLTAPQRVLDTRSPTGSTVDGQHQAVGRIAAGGTYKLPIAGRAGVPGGASTVVLNVTAVTPNPAGYLTVFACGQNLPNASNLNFSAGEVIPNSVLASVGTAGSVCFFSSSGTDLLVDVSGYFP